jgi:hypothetical protein
MAGYALEHKMGIQGRFRLARAHGSLDQQKGRTIHASHGLNDPLLQ